MTEKESILSKIQKLLALSKSPVPAEANAAMAKAQELMLRHNIQVTEVEQKTGYDANSYTRENRGYDFRIDSKYIASVLSRFFFVKIIGDPQHQQFIMIGKKDNVAIAQFLWGHIRQRFDECWQAYKKQNRLQGIDGKKDYYYGLWVGLEQALSADRQRLNKEEGLIVVDDKGLMQFEREEVGKTHDKKKKLNLDDHGVIADGVRDGKNIRLGDRIGAAHGSNFTKTLNLN